MALEESFWIINISLLVILLMMSLGYTIAQRGQMHGFPGKVRFATFGVMSFVLIGILFISYITFLFLAEGLSWTYPIIIGPREYDLANGFWTVVVGVATGIFLGIFALLKKQEWYGR
jgi:hypothetical protein